MDNNQISDRSWLVTFILCLFGGVVGLHRLYSGHVLLAFLYSFTGGLFLIGVIFDLVSLIIGKALG
jgi:TM2 domain-containing membrane protein YozV